MEGISSDGGICSLVFFYALLGILIPRLPFIRSRKRAAVIGGVAFVVAIAASVLADASLTPEQRREQEQTRLADEQKAAERRAAEQQAQEERDIADRGKEIVFLDYLISDYKANELAADAKYKGRTIRVSGVVSHVANDILNQPYVTIGRGEGLELREVQCFLNKSSVERAATLQKGQQVTVRGVVKGLMMNVLLERCEILP